MKTQGHVEKLGFKPAQPGKSLPNRKKLGKKKNTVKRGGPLAKANASIALASLERRP